MKIKNVILALNNQLPLKRFVINFFITRNAWGLFSINSHVNQSTQQLKVQYGSIGSATKAADSMKKKHNKHFSVYKCMFCDGYHIGKSRNSQ